MAQTLIPAHIRDQLLANGARSAAGEDIDLVPVLKLITPGVKRRDVVQVLKDPEMSECPAFSLADLDQSTFQN